MDACWINWAGFIFLPSLKHVQKSRRNGHRVLKILLLSRQRCGSLPSAGKIMAGNTSEDVTALLLNWQSGDDADAPAQLMPLVYDELRRVARAYLQRERADHTLQATALVHEAYLQLVDDKKVTWKDRAHFYGIAARLMRQILMQHARAHQAAKRGGPAQVKLSLEEASELSTDCAVELVALDDALEGFTKIYPRKSKVVELKFFGGMEAKQISEVLQVSEKTVLRDWNFARLWLSRELRKDAA
jgi:RNA polymerase sigma factor (TIGR02999 family)